MKSALLRILLLALLIPGVAIAESHEMVPPTVDEIRALYEGESANWQPAPELLLDAFVAAEDKNFRKQDVWRSVITRYLARRFMTIETRGAITTTAFSILLGRSLSHDEIIDWYVHTIYLGLECYGIDSAAKAYFGKAPEALTLEEAAYLAALPMDPISLHPIDERERAIKRRNFVLKAMLEAGVLTEDEAARAQQADLVVIEPLQPCEKT